MSAKLVKRIRKAVDAAKLPKLVFDTVIRDKFKMGRPVIARYTSPVNHERRIRRAMRRTGQPVQDAIAAYRKRANL